MSFLVSHPRSWYGAVDLSRLRVLWQYARAAVIRFGHAGGYARSVLFGSDFFCFVAHAVVLMAGIAPVCTGVLHECHYIFLLCRLFISRCAGPFGVWPLRLLAASGPALRFQHPYCTLRIKVSTGDGFPVEHR